MKLDRAAELYLPGSAYGRYGIYIQSGQGNGGFPIQLK
jgi:hypothetical protein